MGFFPMWLFYYFGLYLGLFVSVYVLVSDLLFCPFKFNFTFWIFKILNGLPYSYQPLKKTNFISLWFILSVFLAAKISRYVCVIFFLIQKVVYYINSLELCSFHLTVFHRNVYRFIGLFLTLLYSFTVLHCVDVWWFIQPFYLYGHLGHFSIFQLQTMLQQVILYS